MRRSFIWASALVLAALFGWQAANGLAPMALDAYGGPAVGGGAATGFFRLQRIPGAWRLYTPTGDPFWMRAVESVDFFDGGQAAAQVLKTRYGGDPLRFAENANQRLKDWGFNALGGYASAYALPLPTYFRPQGNPVRLPFMRNLNISWYGAIDAGNLAPAPFKTLLAGAVDPDVYSGWLGHVPDVFDPNFEIYARALAADEAGNSRQSIFTGATARGGAPNPSLDDSPWLLATIPDDSDDLFGFGPGPAAPGDGDLVHPDIGWIVAVTRPEQKENTEVGRAIGNRRTVHYSDPEVYAKSALVDFLRRRYGSIAALNGAWGSDYSTFGSDGGWPSGRGFLDESGHNAWLGDPNLQGAAPAARRDLDDFLGLYADRYYRVVSQAIRAATPRQLVFSGVLDESGGMTREPILRAAAKYCDALQVAVDPRRPQLLDQTYSLTGRPVFVWLGIRADSDSAIQPALFHGGAAAEILPSQTARGDAYAQRIPWLQRFRAADGVAPIIGIDWWSYMDKPAEHANWGLVTPRDNAYDGREDSPAGGEEREYGDFIDAVRRANLQADRLLLESR